jgi:hypothetical protein
LSINNLISIDDTCKGQRKATLRGAADVDGHPWPLVSGGARGLVLAMLEPDPSRRPTALRLLGTLTGVRRFWKVFRLRCLACTYTIFSVRSSPFAILPP